MLNWFVLGVWVDCSAASVAVPLPGSACHPRPPPVVRTQQKLCNRIRATHSPPPGWVEPEITSDEDEGVVAAPLDAVDDVKDSTSCPSSVRQGLPQCHPSSEPNKLKSIECTLCSRTFERRDNLNRHLKSQFHASRKISSLPVYPLHRRVGVIIPRILTSHVRHLFRNG